MSSIFCFCALLLAFPQALTGQDPDVSQPFHTHMRSAPGDSLIEAVNSNGVPVFAITDGGTQGGDMMLKGDINLNSGTGSIKFFEGAIQKMRAHYTGSFFQIENRETTGVGSVILDASSTGDLRFQINNVNRLFITNAGNVGIGTTSPGFLLEVNGDAGKPGGGSWESPSDLRLKNVQSKFERNVTSLMNIQPVFYQYKENNDLGINSEKNYVGVIAQEVKTSIPEAVTEDKNGYLHVNNDPIIWTMLNAIKEQQLQIEELENRMVQALDEIKMLTEAQVMNSQNKN